MAVMDYRSQLGIKDEVHEWDGNAYWVKQQPYGYPMFPAPPSESGLPKVCFPPIPDIAAYVCFRPIPDTSAG